MRPKVTLQGAETTQRLRVQGRQGTSLPSGLASRPEAPGHILPLPSASAPQRLQLGAQVAEGRPVLRAGRPAAAHELVDLGAGRQRAKLEHRDQRGPRGLSWLPGTLPTRGNPARPYPQGPALSSCSPLVPA